MGGQLQNVVPLEARPKVLLIVKSLGARFVKIGNEGSCRIISIGNVCLMTSTGCSLLLKDVWYVLEVLLNLISAGWMDDGGYMCNISNGIMKFSKGSTIMAQARKSIHCT